MLEDNRLEELELLLEELEELLDGLELLELPVGGGVVEELVGGGAVEELVGGGALEELPEGPALEELPEGGVPGESVATLVESEAVQGGELLSVTVTDIVPQPVTLPEFAPGQSGLLVRI